MDGSIDLSLEFIDSTYNPVFEVQSLPFIASNFDEMELHLLSRLPSVFPS